MMNNKELVEYLNGLKIIQIGGIEDWEEIPEDIYEKYFKNLEIVDGNLDVDKHRWYETSISIFKNDEGFIGVRSVTDVKGESNCIQDMYWTLSFFEMEEVMKPTYIIKK